MERKSMEHNKKLITLAEKSIERIEQALDRPDELIKDGKTDIKSLKEYANTMKALAEIIKDAKSEQMMIQPLEVVLGECEEFAD